jgi:hypothetical protein
VHQNAPRGTSKTAGSLPIVNQIPGDCKVFAIVLVKIKQIISNHLGVSEKGTRK